MPVLLILLFFPFLVGAFFVLGGLPMSAGTAIPTIAAGAVLLVMLRALLGLITAEEPPASH